MTTTLEPDQPAPSPQQQPAVPRWVIVSFVVGGAALLLLAVVAVAARGGNNTADSQWQGRLLQPALDRPEFHLTDTNGNPYDFQAETGGQLTLVYFGYTNCVDVCPVQMATIAQALSKLQLSVEVVFVTTDPARDTPEVLGKWLANFDAGFIGLTGSADEITAAQKAMGASVAIPEKPDKNGNYLVGHSSGVFVITPDNKVRLTYPFGTRQDDWVQDLPRIAAEPDWQASS